MDAAAVSGLRPFGSKRIESVVTARVTLKRDATCTTPPIVSRAAGLAREQVVTQTVPLAPDVKCTTARQPRCTAAARAVATAVLRYTRAERTLVLSSVRRMRGNPMVTITPI